MKTWIFRILVNRARTRAVREARQVPFSSFETRRRARRSTRRRSRRRRRGRRRRRSTPSRSRLLRGELRGRLAEAVEALPEQQRTVILLRDVAGLDGPEVAEALGISEGNQRVILHRARSRVRADLGEYVERMIFTASPSSARSSSSSSPTTSKARSRGATAAAWTSTCARATAARAYLESFRATVLQLGELPPEPADPHVREHLLAAFSELRGSGGKSAACAATLVRLPHAATRQSPSARGGAPSGGRP